MSQSQTRLTQVLLAPITTEKSNLAGELNNQAVFKVLRDSNKIEIKNAVEHLFNVEVKNVRIVSVPAKFKRRGKKPGWKKAYVALKEGHNIDFVNV